jgi:WD40 repeat protein
LANPSGSRRPLNRWHSAQTGKLLGTGYQGGTVRLLDVGTGLPCPTLRHEHWVSAVALSPDGKWLATGSVDTTARLWPVPRRTITDLHEMELRTWVALGARLDGQGVARPIPWEEWRRLREELQP